MRLDMIVCIASSTVTPCFNLLTVCHSGLLMVIIGRVTGSYDGVRMGCCEWPSRNSDSAASLPVSKLNWPARAWLDCDEEHRVHAGTVKFSPRHRKWAVQPHGNVMCGSDQDTSCAHTVQRTMPLILFLYTLYIRRTFFIAACLEIRVRLPQ